MLSQFIYRTLKTTENIMFNSNHVRYSAKGSKSTKKQTQRHYLKSQKQSIKYIMFM